MSNNLQIISETLRSPQTLKRLALAIGETDAEQTEAKRYAASVLSELEKMAMDKNKAQILSCTPQSIAQVMIDAAKFRLMIDGRQHAHIVQYGSNATLQIGYRGYLAKIAEHYADADINVFPVYEGDDVFISGGDGFDRYEHKRKSAFNDGEAGFQGVVAALYYKKGEREFQKVVTISKTEIARIRKAAKQDFVWSSWFIEKAKVAAIKRICKIQFAQIGIIQEMVEYDNKTHFDVTKPVETVKAGSIVENLNTALAPPPKQIEAQSDAVVMPADNEPEAVPIEQPVLDWNPDENQ